MPLLRQLFEQRRRDRDAELDTAIAGVQLGLDEKRHRWMQFLIAKLELHRRQAQAQTVAGPGSGEARVVSASPATQPALGEEERGDG